MGRQDGQDRREEVVYKHLRTKLKRRVLQWTSSSLSVAGGPKRTPSARGTRVKSMVGKEELYRRDKKLKVDLAHVSIPK